MMTASKLAQIRQTELVNLTFYFRVFGFPRAMEVIEPILARIVSAICEFIQRARTAVSQETAVVNSQFHFSHNIINNFFAH